MTTDTREEPREVVMSKSNIERWYYINKLSVFNVVVNWSENFLPISSTLRLTKF
jgi:hypothetical protein